MISPAPTNRSRESCQGAARKKICVCVDKIMSTLACGSLWPGRRANGHPSWRSCASPRPPMAALCVLVRSSNNNLLRHTLLCQGRGHRSSRRHRRRMTAALIDATVHTIDPHLSMRRPVHFVRPAQLVRLQNFRRPTRARLFPVRIYATWARAGNTRCRTHRVYVWCSRTRRSFALAQAPHERRAVM